MHGPYTGWKAFEKMENRLMMGLFFHGSKGLKRPFVTSVFLYPAP